MSEGQKRKTALQEIKELRQAIEPSKNDVIAQRALDLAEYYLIHAENQAGHIQRLEARNKRMRGIWTKERFTNTQGTSYSAYKCSLCGACYQDIGYEWNYCPNCGADMRGGQDGKDS